MPRTNASALDLTGGAPELNPDFRRLVRAARERGITVIDRCNLTILFEPGQGDLAQFLAERRADISGARELLEALVPLRKKGEIPDWSAETTLNVATDEELLDMFRDAGCTTLIIGFESVSLDDLVGQSARPVAAVMAELSALELSGQVERTAGG